MKVVKQTLPERHKGNGQPKIDGTYFTRASSLAKVLDDQSALINWKGKMAAYGIAHNDDLRALAATTDLKDYRWRDIVERACESAGASSGADIGTSIHTATEEWDLRGEVAVQQMPDEIVADARAYRDLMDAYGFKPLAGEVFVANRALRTAGSFDRLVESPEGTAHILDIKTVGSDKDAAGAAKWSGVAWAIQTAVYANAKPYDADRGYLEWADLDLPEPVSEGLAAYIVVIPRGSGTAALVDIDLTAGKELAQLAAQVRDARRSKPAAPRLPQEQLTTKED